jgi:hypothetical protein
MITAATDWVIRNLNNTSGKQGMETEGRPYRERYLTAVFMVAMAIRKPMIPTSIDTVMWPKRSPAWSECLSYCVSKYSYRDRIIVYLDIKYAAQAANNHGGAHSNKDTVGLYPRVALRVGKKRPNDRKKPMIVNSSASHQTFQSVSACFRPDSPLSKSSISSSSIRNRARACSSAVSQ